jgi:Activator of Hsp90 ATPase homolog 1-like protein
MTKDKSFKRLVRARMDKTGERYAAARAALLAGEEPAGTEPPVLATSDAEIRRRTGRGWEDWFALLDEWDAGELAHREIARRVADELGIAPLVWEAQAVTYSYERARGLRVVGQRADGFTVTAAKTMAVPVDGLFDAFANASQRDRWVPDHQLIERTATKPKSIRFDWADGRTRVNVAFEDKGAAKSTVTIEHARLADATEADRMKAYWRERLTSLKAQLERGEGNA